MSNSPQPIGAPVPGWTARPAPPRTPMQGRFCRVEPLDPARHGEELFAANRLDAEGRNWTYLNIGPFERLEDYRAWLDKAAAKDDPFFHAIIDLATGKAVGVAAYMRIEPRARRDRGRQHQLLAAAAAQARRHRGHVPDDGAACSTSSATAATSGNAIPSTRPRARRRRGWASNTRAIFRQAVVNKGRNRDTDWFSIIDSEWPALKRAYQAVAGAGELRRGGAAEAGAEGADRGGAVAPE